jgi:molecular chaperone GrpE
VAEEPVTKARAASESQPEEAREPVAQPDQQLLRALADLDNVRKRFERELTRERAAERARLAAQWLPVVDDLERALDHVDGEGDAFATGVRAVYEQALRVLERLGFPRFDDIGQPFDPVRHEALGAVESDAPPGTVASTTRAGYGTDDNLLRPATVLVARRRE